MTNSHSEHDMKDHNASHFFGGSVNASPDSKTIRISQQQQPLSQRITPTYTNSNTTPNPSWFAESGNNDFFGSLSQSQRSNGVGGGTNIAVEETAEDNFDQISSVSASLSALEIASVNACPRCRRVIDANSLFCKKCGYQLGNLVSRPPMENPESLVNENPPRNFFEEPGNNHLFAGVLEQSTTASMDTCGTSYPRSANPPGEQKVMLKFIDNENIYNSGSSHQPQQKFPPAVSPSVSAGFTGLNMVPEGETNFTGDLSRTIADTSNYSGEFFRDHPLAISPQEQTTVPLMRSGTIESFVSGQFQSERFSVSQVPTTNTAVPSQNFALSGSQAPLTSFALPPKGQRPMPTRIPLISSQFPVPMEMAQPLHQEQVFSSPKPSRIHPTFCFGFGGYFYASFPMKQMRFTMVSQGQQQTGVAHYSPGSMHRISLSGLPGIRERLIEPILFCLDGLPISDKFVKTKDIISYLNSLMNSNTPSRDGREALLKLLHLMLSYKGGMGSAGEEAVRKILLRDPFPNRIDALTNSHTETASSPQASGILSEITKLLIRGDRSNAVMLAVAQQMWTHALLIASHVDRDTYCATVGEFARQSIPVGHPLRTMYLLFAGQHALAGAELQQNAFGLKTSWELQLAMIMANRTADDYLTIMGLGDSLQQVGNIFAAHVCYLLSDDANLISGPDIDYSRIVYLGCNHELHRCSFYRDWSALRLTEILEYALRQASNGQYMMHHLQAYKLLFANFLCDLGLGTMASNYYDILNDVVRAGSSNYLHAHLLSSIKSSQDRLIQHAGGVPSADHQGGWLPKMGGILEAFDRGLTRVIGVTTDSGADVNVASNEDAAGQRRLSVQAEESSLITTLASMPMYKPAISPVTPSTPSIPDHNNSGMVTHGKIPQQAFYQNQSQHEPKSFDSWSQPSLPRQPSHHSYVEASSAQLLSEYYYAQPPSREVPPPMSAVGQNYYQQQSSFVPLPQDSHQTGITSSQKIPEYEDHGRPTSQPVSPTLATSFPQPLFRPPQYSQPAMMMEIPQAAHQPPQQNPSIQGETMVAMQTNFPPLSSSYQVEAASKPTMSAVSGSLADPSAIPRFPINPPPPQPHVQTQVISDASQIHNARPVPIAQIHMQEDDFGFGNKSLAKTNAIDIGQSRDPSIQEKRSVLGFITGLFGRKSAEQSVSAPKQANLGEPSSFRYDEKLKRWVDDNDSSTLTPAIPPPPPPASASPHLSATTPPMPTSSPSDFRKGANRSARSRYVDPFNPNASVESASAIPVPSIPTPGHFSSSRQGNYGDPYSQSQESHPNYSQPPSRQMAYGNSTDSQHHNQRPWQQQQPEQNQYYGQTTF